MSRSDYPITTRPSDRLKGFDDLPNDAFVRQPVVETLFCCSAATVWRRVKDRKIPSPHKISDRVTGWNVGELRAAIATKLGHKE